MPTIQVPINNTLPWTQEVATNNQTVFSTNWTADVATDVVVYSRAAAATPNDATQIVSTSDYNVAFVGSNEYVEVTFSVGRVAGDIVTIMRNTPADRLNLYINTNFAPTMLNGDFGRMVMMIQQRLLTDIQLAPKYNNSATLNPNNITDIILPILPANHVWKKNDQNTAIETALLPANPVGSVGGNFGDDKRLVRTNIDGGLNNIEETTVEITDANVVQSTAGSWGLDSADDLNIDATGDLNFKGQTWPAAIGANGTVIGVNGGILAYLNVPTTPSPTTVDNIPMFVNTTGSLGDSPFNRSGDNLLLPADPTVNLAAVTKQYVDNLIGGSVATVTGTPNQVEVDNTDPNNPVVLLPNEIITPGTIQSGNIKIDTNTISSEDTNGNINLTPDGTGKVISANSQVTNLTASQMVATDGSKNLVSVAFDPTDLPYAVLQDGSPIYGADSGSTDSYEITLSPAPIAYVAGMEVRFSANTVNTSGATLNVNGLGALPILKFHDQPLNDGDIEAGQISTVICDGTNWQLQSAVAVFAPPGQIVKVSQVNKLDTYTLTSSTFTLVPGLQSAVLMPVSVSSTFVISVALNSGGVNLNNMSLFRRINGGTWTAIAQPTSPGSRTATTLPIGANVNGGVISNAAITYLDSPTTIQSVEYAVFVAAQVGGFTVYINRSADDTNSSVYQRAISSMCVMEVA